MPDDYPHPNAAGESQTPKVVWDDSNMRMSYANVVNATSTREEVTLFFGVNKTWNASEKEFHVALTDRIVVNPFAAKRLVMLLSGVLAQYEKRYGPLDLDLRDPSATNP
ncbi:DUF3467 domain-containing protein [Mangrovicoccus ximenensis]|uniref:DUF3467 domain-containing protein n=1 Tax=Mangrovicoccus ximenensis TaxID=1911570 RepID=UPI000D3B6C81|nr:DUF3467 domain-containing protein [Mangrovicoccus ximenensis]